MTGDVRYVLALAVGVTSSVVAREPAADVGSENRPADASAGPPTYSADAVAKAEAILGETGWKVSGGRPISVAASDLNRRLSDLRRVRRTMRPLLGERDAAAAQVRSLRTGAATLRNQYTVLNTRVAAGLPVAEHNRVVAAINANLAKQRTVREAIETAQSQLDAKAAEVLRAEADYVREVLEIQQEIASLRETLTADSRRRDIRIALKVSGATQPPDVDGLLTGLERKWDQISKGVFREEIPLTVRGNSLFVDAVVGESPLRMVLDSGASIITLPSRAAAELKLSIPADAPTLTLSVADGRTIPAREVTLPVVRVGTFEVRDVRAAVMTDDAFAAEPLLGNSFLKHFQFEIDQSAKTLKLVRVEE